MTFEATLGEEFAVFVLEIMTIELREAFAATATAFFKRERLLLLGGVCGEHAMVLFPWLSTSGTQNLRDACCWI
jgi:hypothetical protein